MFARRRAELQQRQLELRLRNIELRAELHAGAQSLARPMAWLGIAGIVAALAAGAYKPGRVLRAVGLLKMGLRLARLLKSFSA
jgi:hypothetical protein